MSSEAEDRALRVIESARAQVKSEKTVAHLRDGSSTPH